jgi:hypothetical protein
MGSAMTTGRQNQVRSPRRLSFDWIDTHNEAQTDALIQQVLEAGNAIATRGNDPRGIIDERGNLLRTDLPEDMRKDADTDFGG